MDEKYFNIVESYGAETEKLYNRLIDLGVDEEMLDHSFEEINSLYDKYLKLGKELDEKNYIGEEATLREAHQNLPAYTRVELIYKYDSGFYLCSTTDLETYLIPSEKLNL